MNWRAKDTPCQILTVNNTVAASDQIATYFDLRDQFSADQAVENFNGAWYCFGMPISPTMIESNPRSTKVFVRQLPSNVDWAEIENLAATFGDVLSSNHGGTAEAPSAVITYKTSEQATEAAEKLDKKEINGVPIKASIYVERNRNARRNAGGGAGYPNALGVAAVDYAPRQMNNPAAAAGLPLRMVVGARYVGAIIGQGGANIREITRDSKARCVVDVNRGLRDQSGNVEKVINVYGTADSCSKACSKILEVVQREAAKDAANEGKTIEPELKLRAHNNLVGRLIGKGGSTIKKIMEETGCTIFVSNTADTIVVSTSRNGSPLSGGAHGSPVLNCAGGGVKSGIINPMMRMMPGAAGFTGSPFYCHSISELTAFNMERTITVRGSLDNVGHAESKISAKLRQCWETDVANAPGAVYGGVHPFVSIPPMGGPVDPYCYPALPGAFVPPVPPVGAIGGRPPGAPMHAPAQPHSGAAFSPVAAASGGAPVCYTEVVHIWVPNNVVGALIGTKGVHIRNIMRLTGAHIRIESTKTEANAAVEQTEQSQSQNENQNEAVVPQENQGGGGGNSRQLETERRVTITGTDQQQYKAQYWIFQRLSEHGHYFFDEVRLCTEIQVPSKLVGRIIGKGGQNVRELQRMTGAQVKIPEDAATQEENEDTLVRIIGSFNASQAVQARIRQLVHQFHVQQPVQPRAVSADRQRANSGRGVNHYSEGHE